jgi:tRNA A37 threonylcarbamoyladenosine biosynthesis protein TsaE
MLFQPPQQPFSDHKSTSNVLPSTSFHTTLTLHIPTLEAMEEMGALLSVLASPPDAIFLHGDLGAGKTSLSRCFILCKTGQEDSGMRVTSPTYFLSNT